MQGEAAGARRRAAGGNADQSSTGTDWLWPTGEESRGLTPEVFLPGQEPPTRADHWLSRLYLALLVDTFKCLGAHGRRQREAWEWVRSEAEHCFSFAAVCAVLQLNASAVRGKVTERFGLAASVGEASRLPRRRVRGRHGAGGPAL
jgi:hypothetical protein